MKFSETIFYKKIMGLIRLLKLRFFVKFTGESAGVLYKHKEKVSFFRGKKISVTINNDVIKFENYDDWKYIQTRKGEKGSFQNTWNITFDKQLRHWEFGEIEKGEKVLDVGFRDGHNLIYLLKKGIYVEGIEVNPYAVENAKKMGCIVFEEDIQKRTHYADKTFDVISACDVLEHCFAPKDALREIFRILKDDGRVILEIPFEEEFQQNLIHGHSVLFHNERKFTELVKSLNFRVIKTNTEIKSRNLFLLKK